jgi:hypothetical protein
LTPKNRTISIFWESTFLMDLFAKIVALLIESCVSIHC